MNKKAVWAFAKLVSFILAILVLLFVLFYYTGLRQKIISVFGGFFI